MANPWLQRPRLPPGPAAALAALHLDEPKHLPITSDALDYCDRSGLTLPLRAALAERIPRLEEAYRKNLVRLAGIRQTQERVARCLNDAGIEFVGLKGLTHCSLFGIAAEERVQYDLDLYIPPEQVHAAHTLLIERGYTPLEGMERFPTDHLPALVPKNDWKWRGDFFDPEIPLHVELHFRFWNEELERLRAPGVAEFWDRRNGSLLYAADALAYATLHLLRHLLQGSVKTFHVYEVARILDATAENDKFWDEWRALHPGELRRLQAVVFRLSQEWFGGRASVTAQEEIARLPAGVQIWFEEFATSPAISEFRPNKDQLWLHLSLLDSPRDRVSVALRRLIPRNLPPRADAAHTAARLRHHALSLPGAVWNGARWWWRTNSFGSQFWMFLASAVVFNLALFVFVLLYNLFLMDLGFGEGFLGVVNGALRAGSLVGTLPAAYVAHRFGLRATLLVTIATTAVVEVLRASIGARFPLAALAFVSGCIFAVWAVILAPSIAAAVDERRRPAAFSVFFATMFSLGIAGNWLGGRLPGWLGGKQPVLIASAVLSAVALIPAWRFTVAQASRPVLYAADGDAQARRPVPLEQRVWPRGPFLIRFLIPFAVWHLATGAFNPFNNAYFQRLGFRVERIGEIFSASQAMQVISVLLAPLIIRQFGLVTGIAWMMAATAAALSGLAAQPQAAATAYIAYMAFQWMSEPGLNTLLMNKVNERERGGASSLNYLVAFGAQTLAAFGAGALVASFGYGPILAGAAALAGVAAVLFKALLR